MATKSDDLLKGWADQKTTFIATRGAVFLKPRLAHLRQEVERVVADSGKRPVAVTFRPR